MNWKKEKQGLIRLYIVLGGVAVIVMIIKIL